MKLDMETWCETRRLRMVEKASFAEIAKTFGVSERTARKWFARESAPEKARRSRTVALDAHADTIRKLAAEYDHAPARVFRRLQESGVATSLRSVQRWMERNSAKAAEKRVFNLLSFEPGEAAQTDFGSCGTILFGDTPRRLSVCVTVLCHSRLMHAEFIPCERQEHFLACQRHAFEAFGGVPRKLIVDNCRCAVLAHRPGQVSWNPGFLAFCNHYSVKPVACTPRHPWAKGIVERMVGYVKDNVAKGRRYSCIEEANAHLADWLANHANPRKHGSTGFVPEAVFRESERGCLLPLPSRPFPCVRTETRIPDPYARVEFDGNFYSVPVNAANAVITLKASPDEVLLYHAEALVARHARCYARRQNISLPEHTQKTRSLLPPARRQNARNDFLKLGAEAAEFLRGVELRTPNVTGELLKMLALRQMYGEEAFQRALHEAVAHAAFRAAYLEHLLTRPRGVPDTSPLRIPHAADQMEIPTPATDMDIYKVE